MVNAADQHLKAAAQQPADQGHQGLEAAEIQAHQQGLPRRQPLCPKPLADGDGKGVHTQAYGDQE